MTLYYSIVFALLCFEMSMFMVLIVPLPFTWRRKLFHFLATNPVVAKIQYGLKITFIFVAILFVDAVQRMVKVMSEGETARDNRGVQDVRTETNYAARKFYSQRNMYLTGFTLFLSLILSRTYSLILDLINTQEELVALKKGSKTTGTGADIEKKYLQEIDTLKKQTKQQQQEYNRLSDELAKATGNVSTKKD
ncbi:endoplasmic reticulum protein [Moesziomyces aphidis]|uniref:Related to B-cell receptor-associated protein and related proteins n=4 Tax=Moesziomyces TaxID=63261 RepID=A0A5C3FKA4_PSEA2|nr:endoplasmic reticulum protein [Moesziomyces antarcticus]ETS60889.1 endoplasmic reticulum protein [Moesziomyces aphidis]GAC72499.1 B-cell receptor-associated protein and related proteins [Moesziomyces antarcticus T-34]GAK64003.1 endoplasmic reticulum protein [Moesziomyces antarcticus]SPO44784.1 related to B-cell receptor-associated protein and related proteins [Moesziomyces antarcticus]